MILAWTFWLLLLAPGACLLRRLRPAGASRSVFETISYGYALSFVVLAPLCVVAYALTLPLWVFSAGVALAIIAGLAGLAPLARSLRMHDLRGAIRAEYLAATFAILFFLVHASAIGGHIVNDADFHLARIRLLYDHGLTNADPITNTGFSHPYHTNIVHALVASGSKLTGLDPIAFWQSTLPWATLVLASGVATLCLCLGGSGLAAWLVCLFQLGYAFRLDWALYPNQLGPLWLLPVGLGAFIGFFATEHTRFYALLIGSCALLLGLVHGLYAGYFAVLGAVVIGVLSIQRVIARRGSLGSTVRRALLGAVLLALPAPSLYVARATHVPTQSNFEYQGGAPTARESKPGRWTRSLRPDDEGRFHLSASRLLGGTIRQILACAALLMLLARKRFIEVLALSASLGTCLVVLNVPVLATFVSSKLGAVWMLERLLDVVFVQFVALVGAGLVPSFSPRRPAVAVALGFAPLVLAVIGVFVGSGGFTAGSLDDIERSLEGLDRFQVFSASLPQDLQLEQALVQRIPKGAVVLTHPLAARQLRKLHDIRFVRASRNHTGVDDMLDRTVAMSQLMNAKGPTKEVQALLQKYGITYAIQKKDHRIRWLADQPAIAQTEYLKLIKLDPSTLSKQR